MKSNSVARIDLFLGLIDACRRNDLYEFAIGCTFVPFSDGGEAGHWITAITEIHWRIENELVADQPAGVIPRRVIIIRSQVIGRTIRKPTIVSDVKEVDLGTTSPVAVTNHRDRIAGHKHFVIPIAARIDV